MTIVSSIQDAEPGGLSRILDQPGLHKDSEDVGRGGEGEGREGTDNAALKKEQKEKGPDELCEASAWAQPRAAEVSPGPEIKCIKCQGPGKINRVK